MCARFCARRRFQFRAESGRLLPEEGLTLVELVVSLVVVAILLTMWGKFLIDFYANREAVKVAIELQEQAEFAMDHMVYGFIDPAGSSAEEAHREAGIIWASDCRRDSATKLSFLDPSSSSWIVYEEREKKLVRHPASSSSPARDWITIIPYRDGYQEYRKSPYEVAVNFDVRPDKSVTIKVTVTKDRLSSELSTTVTPRNWARE
ncbi:MAG: prepilin-type N-terminal cleavage/methylation domain-containing protein [bacterium]